MTQTAKAIEFHFDFGSPNAYLAYKVLPGIAARQGAELNLIPVLLGGVFRATDPRPRPLPASATAWNTRRSSGIALSAATG